MGSKERDVDGRIVSVEGHKGVDITDVRRLTLPAENNCRKPNPCQRKEAFGSYSETLLLSAASVNQQRSSLGLLYPQSLLLSTEHGGDPRLSHRAEALTKRGRGFCLDGKLIMTIIA
jgi:hypothetical protein